ncbi:MAG: glycosyltransferase [Planctomycetes bacterium]|nr:glycosyltransferase [Planctomycetota bacterium]
MITPDVSVVLPVFNGARTVGRAIQSILEQTLQDIELIVVDDGSTDDTVAVVRASADPRLRLLECPHRGIATATNAATQVARSPFIARMDADDFSYPQRLEKQLEFLQAETLDVVGCKVCILDPDNNVVDTMKRYERWINEETVTTEQVSALRFVELPLVNPTILARRHYFELGFRDGGFPEDYDLMLRAANQGMRFGKVDEVLFDWTDSPTRVTRTDSRYSSAAFNHCRQTHLLEGPLKGVKRIDLWGVGQTGKLWLRWLLEQGINVRMAFDVNKRKVGTTIHDVRIVHPDQMRSADGTLLIVGVGAEGARELIITHILSREYQLGADAWFVA